MNQLKTPSRPSSARFPPIWPAAPTWWTRWIFALKGSGNDPALVSVFVGARGAGKTALLSLFANMAEENDWVSARVTSSPDMLEEILLRINRGASHLIDGTPKRKLASVSIAPIGSLSWDNREDAKTSWRTRMDDVLDQLEEAGVGLVVTIDEVDPDLDEMTTLVTAFQHFLDENRKVALLMAGLPYGLTALLAGKTTSFLRRATRHDLASISDYEVAEAFRITMEKGGKALDDEALTVAVEPSVAFPTCSSSSAIEPGISPRIGPRSRQPIFAALRPSPSGNWKSAFTRRLITS